jgi:hypothetical protein
MTNRVPTDDAIRNMVALVPENRTVEQAQAEVPFLQVAVYVMCGGGFLGQMAAEQPANFYIDDRAARLPYSEQEIKAAVSVLTAMASRAGLDAHALPPRPTFHGFCVL